ncbi:GerMN domain-containing protein [Paenibacillus sp. 481]|uniref:GerMN domain-containing protein n=1 Tax=Paenibacillus sp. 481 TaxID=2835869 RepID=UPI001E2F89E4|nr:GerMN domain-containing protein [Paenibacillus sp. 481]UHA74398.1 GerMN domain-containing protein [Paenibacillus sp. 481]
MMQVQMIRRGALVFCVTVPLLITACGGGESALIDTPPAELEAQMLAAADGQSKATAATMNTGSDEHAQKPNMTVYVKDRNGYLAPISYHWDQAEPKALATAALEMLVKGGVHQQKLPAGFTAPLPEGTRVLNVKLEPKQKLAIVEFSKSFADYEPKQERELLESITWTLTSLPDVERVQLWLDSKKLNEMPVDGTPLDIPLSRSYGINVEKGDSVNYLHSMPVTLYFSAMTQEGKGYYVPVTRLIEPSQDPVTATIQQIIAGPLDKQALAMVATQETKINSIERKEDVITVDLADSMFEKGERVPSELLHAVVLSLTEQAGVGKVQIRINGVADIRGTDEKDYSQPVSRPVVNPMWKG